jgi:hypothetical protein
MPVNTNVQNLKAILDACADYKDVVIDNPKALAIAEEFTNTVGGPEDNETKAAQMLDMLISNIVGTCKAHVEIKARQDTEAAIVAAGAAANGNF